LILFIPTESGKESKIQLRDSEERPHSMNIRAYKVLIVFFSLLLFLEAGCSTTHEVTQKVYRSLALDKPELKKRVLILPILDQAQLGEEKIKSLTDRLVSALIKDGNVVVAATSNPGTSTERMKSPGYGIVIEPEQAKKAAQMGMNVLLTAVITPIDFTSRRAGIWPFRKVRHEGEISMVVNAFDLATGTLFLSHIESKKVRAEVDIFDEGEEGTPAKPEIDANAVEKALAQIVDAQASKVSDALREQPWSGKILSASGDEIIVSAGRDVGLTVGQVFNVYGRGEPIRCADGSLVAPLGLKLGEIKVTEVQESQAVATPLASSLFKAGQVIRPKS
jgi:hypothetical protein